MSQQHGVSGKRRGPLSSVVTRLEEELRDKQQQLVREITRNALSKAGIGLLGALSEARLTLHHLSATASSSSSGRASGSAAAAADATARASLQRLDELVSTMCHALAAAQDAAHGAGASQRGAASSGGSNVAGGAGTAASGGAGAGAASSSRASARGGSGAPPAAVAAGGGALAVEGDDSAPQPSGSMATAGASAGSAGAGTSGAERGCMSGAGSSTGQLQHQGHVDGRGRPVGGSSCLRASFIVQRAATLVCEPEMGQEQFRNWWMEAVRKLSMLLHRQQSGLTTAEELEQALSDMACTACSLFLSHDWFAELLLTNLETGGNSSPPSAWWKNVAACVAPNPHQSFLLHASHDWARSAHSTLRTECLDLASRALRLEGIILPSPDPQDDFVWGLDRVQGSFRIMVAAHDIIGISLLKPEQLAQLYIASFPYLPAWAEIVAHLPRADS